MQPPSPARLSRVLAPIDGEQCSLDALKYAVELCKHVDADLDIIHAWKGISDSPPSSVMAEQAGLDSLLAKVDVRGLRACSSALVKAEPVKAIVDTAKTNISNLIVMGTHGRSGVSRLLLGSVAETVSRMASCPVLTIRSSTLASKSAQGQGPACTDTPALAIKRILVPVDFSDNSLSALHYACEFALRVHATLHVIYTWQDAAVGRRTVKLPIRPTQFSHSEQMKAYAHDKMQAAIHKYHLPEGIISEFHVVKGKPAETIVEHAANTDSQLLIMGAQGVSGIDEWILGSVAKEIKQLARCPVITVPPRR